MRRKKRLMQALGRWLLESQEACLSPDIVTPELVASMTAGISQAMASSIKTILYALFPDQGVYRKRAKVAHASNRDKASEFTKKHIADFPEKWKQYAASAFHFCPDAALDGPLVERWRLATIVSVVSSTAYYFEFCRVNELSVDICPRSVRIFLNFQQGQFYKGEKSINTIKGNVQCLQLFAMALFPDQNWSWLSPVVRDLKRRSKLHASRNDARIVDLAEFRRAGEELAAIAMQKHKVSTSFRERVSATKMARTALIMGLLANSPIRVRSLASLDIKEHFSPALTEFRLSACETKDGKPDHRILNLDLQKQLRDYIEIHREVVAPTIETRLFIGRFGRPMEPGSISADVAAFTEKIFGRRVSPQVVRNMVAGFIVSQAPEKAGLATIILNHSSAAVTETYRLSAEQVIAGEKLRSAYDFGKGQAENDSQRGSRVVRLRSRKGVSR